MKRFVSLALVLVMVVSLLSGCQKPMDAQTLVKKMNEATADRIATSMHMEMDMDMTLKMQGISMDMAVDMAMDLLQDDANAYVDMDMNLEMLGVTQDMGMESYTTMEDGKFVTYAHSAVDDTWTRQETEQEPQSATLYAALGEIDPEALVLDEETQMIAEREAYVLRATMTGEQMQQTIGSVMDSMSQDMDEATKSVMSELDLTALSVPLVCYIDCETYLPLQMEMEIQGLGEMMTALMEAVMAQAGESLEEVDLEEMEFDIPNCLVKAQSISFDPVEVPAVPQEGIDAANVAAQQAAGIFILRSGDDAVQITLPEGYTSMMAEEDYLLFANEFYSVCGEYAMYFETEDEALDYIQTEIQYAQEEGYYESHSEVAQVDGFSTMQIVYVDGTVDYYAWKLLDGCVLDVLVSVYDPAESEAVNALLACVEEYAD